jgi:ABC-type nitrate/sulfonate/bicarbonate transport system substrate-binding protein
MGRLSTLVLLALLTTAAHGRAKESVRLCMPRGHEDLLNMALLVARDNGIFQKNGLDVKVDLVRNKNREKGKERSYTFSEAGPVLPFNSEDWELTDLILGKNQDCDIAVSPVVGLLATNKTDISQLKPLYMTAYGTDYDTHLVVKSDSPIKTVKDLKGKMVRLGQVPTHIALYQMLKKNGMNMSDVSLRFKLPSNFAAEALAKGEIDAAVTYVPTMPMMLASGKVRVLEQNIISKHVMPRTPNAVLFTSSGFAKKNPAAVEKFKRAVVATMELINKDPSLVLKSATGYFQYRHGDKWKGWKVDPAQAERATAFLGKLSIESFEDPAQAAVIRQQMTEYQTLLLGLGYIPKKIDFSAWFTSLPSQAAL